MVFQDRRENSVLCLVGLGSPTYVTFGLEAQSMRHHLQKFAINF
ncbi:hypothetical protein RESH_05171 [Rhodopirellula europaea SH398]|uniref:Uncharacterized protein n=1 Tax=Rhodopirellula europaea SH398 TaxID=1263868 RepID=M5RYE3_9BACT|nr:hypothetical protein RESH_05171 [Rhodopirellula europaea SH398]